MAQTARERRRLTTANRLALVQEVAARLAESRGSGDVVVSIRSTLEAGLGADAMVLSVLTEDGTGLETLAATGTSARTRDHLQKPVQLDASLPASSVLSSGEPVYWSTTAERNRKYPQYADFPSACECWTMLPLTVHGTTLGVLSIGWVRPRRFRADFSALLFVLAQQCAVAIDRARLEEIARDERSILELMSEGTRLMVSDLDPDHIVQRLVRLAVPRLAPSCSVYVAEETSLRRVAAATTDQVALHDGPVSVESVAIDSPTPLAACYRDGVAQVVANVTEREIPDIYRDATGEPILSGAGPWTGLAVPIRAAGQTIGVMSLVSREWAGAPPSSVCHAAEGLAGRAGVALMNARRYHVEHLTASLLTESLLPSLLPEVPGFETTTRYIPIEGRVAGDWFDIVRLPAGPVLVGVGDVGGHGVRAAALTGQLRNAAKGLALAGCRPGRIIRGLAELTLIDADPGFATVLYGLLDPTDGVFAWSSAGHIPPLAFGSGKAQWLELADHPPFGVAPKSEASERRHQLARGDGILLVTDGVFERRGIGIVRRLEELRAAVAKLTEESLDAVCDAIVREFCAALSDDACIVALRRR